MRNAILVCTCIVAMLGASACLVSAQVPSAGDMQQKLDQEMANAKRSASESSSNTRQGASNMKTEAERKMDDEAAQHRSQAEGKMTEEIEKAKRKAMGR